jgi:hypothetical protein
VTPWSLVGKELKIPAEKYRKDPVIKSKGGAEQLSKKEIRFSGEGIVGGVEPGKVSGVACNRTDVTGQVNFIFLNR